MYRLYNADCLDTMRRLPPGRVDLVLTDPPYGTTACAWDSVVPLEPMWACIKHVTKPAAPTVMTAIQPFTSALGASNLPDLRYSWAWVKENATGFLNARRMPMRIFEDVLVFYRGSSVYHPQDVKACNKLTRRGRKSDCYGDSQAQNTQTVTNYPRTLLHFKRDAEKLHPTQKPVALMEYLIRTYTSPGALVLDFTMGSGTTGVACANTGRQFVGIERDPSYFQIARRRIREAYAINYPALVLKD